MSGFWEMLVDAFASPVDSLVSEAREQQQESVQVSSAPEVGFGSHQAACEADNAFSSFDWSASGNDYFNHGSGSGFTSNWD